MVFVKTTIEIPDDLFRRVKIFSAVKGIPLKVLFAEALAEKVNEPESQEAVRPWMEFYGKGEGFINDLEEIDAVIQDEFEIVNENEWK